MILVLRPGATEADVAEVLLELERNGCAGRAVRTDTNTVVHVTGGRARRARRLRALEAVLEIVPTSGPRVRREGWRFFPYHFLQWSAFGVALLGVLVFLAGMLPTGVGESVDYRHPPESVSHPWYLGLPLSLVRLFPSSAAWLAWLLCAVLALGVLLLPVLDRSQAERGVLRTVRLLVALVAVGAVVASAVREVGP